MRKAVLVFCCLLLGTGLSGCREAIDIFASDVKIINSRTELFQEVEQSLKEGKTELSFETEELGESDFRMLNESHDGFFGRVASYEIKTLKFMNTAQVTLRLETMDNYYVEKAYLAEEEIPADREKAAELLEVCEEVLSEMSAEEDPYKIEKKIHDYLVTNVTYGYPKGDKKEDAFSAYGALVEGKAVCNGYAQAMKLLCDLSGLECEMVTGTADGEAHAWNLVCLDEEWYQVDVTWDDPSPDVPGRIFYAYFNITDRQLGNDHVWEKEHFPQAEGTKYNFFQQKNRVYKNYQDFHDNVEEIFEDASPEHFQVQVGDYSKETYSGDNLQFLFPLSGAKSLSIETVGKNPYTTLYFTLSY
ncbi:MAG: hypothetical protein MRZ41_10945 [Eubacterium sp.]|nr:hypothetical protein [Eubacterium sp.]